MRKEDPTYPGNGVEEEGQCCSCCEVVLLDDVERNKGYVCRGFESERRTRCFHAICHECKELEFPDAGLVYPCAHFETDGKVLVEKLDGEPLRKSDSTPFVPKDPMIDLLREFKHELIEGRQGQQSKSHTQHEGTVRSTLKTSATMEFPKGSADALMDLDSWLREFDRVVAHLSGSWGLIPEDRIAHLLSFWGPKTDPGENMRLDQQSDPYLNYEREGQMENCWQVLLARLNRYCVEPSEARRAAEALWNGLYWPGEIDAFHTSMRRAVTSMRRVHMPSIGRAYQGAGGGGIPHARQRVAWANDKRMAQAPLGLLASPKSQQQSGGKGRGKGAGDGECNICQGNGHKGAQCPNHKAKKDRVFLRKPEASRDVVATSVVALATGSTIMSRMERRSRGRSRKAEAGRSPVTTGGPSAVA